MKNKLLRILAIIFFALIFLFNIGANLNITNFFPMQTVEAWACSLQAGDCIPGVECEVTGVMGPDSYIFSYEDCVQKCDPGGTNCCFILNDGCGPGGEG